MSKRWDTRNREPLQNLVNELQRELNIALRATKDYRATCNTVALLLATNRDKFPNTVSFRNRLNEANYDLENVRIRKSIEHLRQLWFMLRDYKE